MRKLEPMLLVPSELAKAVEEETKAREVLNSAISARQEIESRSRVICEECGNTHEIKNLIYYQTQWYVSPRGCNEGDYMRNGEGQWECSCKHINRLYDNGGEQCSGGYAKMDVVALRSRFKEVVYVER